MNSDLTRRVIAVVIVWLFSYLLSLGLTSLIPFLQLSGAYWGQLHTVGEMIPAIALVTVMTVEMVKRHEFDRVALVITFLIGLPGALFYFF